MTRAASQAGDAESSRTPGLNTSIQTSMNDHVVRYHLCHNKSASVIPYFILAVKSCQERLNLDETQGRYFKYMSMSCNLNYSAWIANWVA